MSEKVETSKVINYAGAFIALLIGSGFATGQEIMQYFSSYGYLGMLSVLLCFFVLTFVGIQLVKAGYKERFQNPNDVYKYFCGKKIGTFFDYYSTAFIFLSYTVMVAGAKATAIQHFHLNKYLGGGVFAILVMTTVVFGLKRIVDVIGKIGPVIIVLAIVVGLLSIIKNLPNLSTAAESLKMAREQGIMKVASNNFLLAMGSYVGFSLMWLAAFLAQIGKNANSEKEAKLGAFLGALGFSLATLVMSFAVYLSLSKVHDSQIPVLLLAGEISPLLANIFSIIIMMGIYTTAVPLLWTVTARFSKEKTTKYRILTILLGIIGAMIGLFIDFSALVNVVYVFNGYIGMIMIFIMFAKYLNTHR